jgi:hypothetical protein
MRGLGCGCALVLGLALAPILFAVTPAGPTPVGETSGLVRPADAVPLFPDVPASGYPDRFPFGQCTWWAAYNVHVTWMGDAGSWVANARAGGRAISPVPIVHSIVVYRASPGYSWWGHVGVVVAVDSAGFRVSEMNYADGGRGTGMVDQRESRWPDGLVEGFILPG